MAVSTTFFIASFKEAKKEDEDKYRQCGFRWKIKGGLGDIVMLWS